jgi:Ser/Thr protein kinase RdoA (MazF antagonist)
MRATYERFFNDNVLSNAMKAFELVGEPKALNAAENFVYECADKNGQSKILRISSEIHKPYNQICAEIDYINYLYDSGAPVAKVLQSAVGRFVETIESEKAFFWGVVFEKVEGRHIKRNELDSKFITLWGKEIGKLHKLAKSYKSGQYLRQQWFEQDYYAKPETFISGDDDLISAHKNLVQKIKSIPTNSQNYTLIHTDIHTQNMLWNDKSIVIIDFDDCAYAHFAFDLAVAFWYGVHFDKEKSIPFWNDLMDGYSSENIIPKKELSNIPLFHLLRFSTIYLALHHQLSALGFTPEQQERLDEIRQIAISSKLPLDIDYCK